jgi:hypothetical protein
MFVFSSYLQDCIIEIEAKQIAESVSAEMLVLKIRLCTLCGNAQSI